MAQVAKNPPVNAGDTRDVSSIPGRGRSPGEENGKAFLYFLPGKSHGQRSLAGYSPWGHEESDETQHAHIMPDAACRSLEI